MSKFGTVINCMDGRVQQPVFQYLKETLTIDYLDTITEAGVDKVLSDNTNTPLIENIKERVAISVLHHGSKSITIVGHHDCAGNPVLEKEHKKHISQAMITIREWEYDVTIKGLWVDSSWSVSEIIT
jgi:carbonic anhydrase